MEDVRIRKSKSKDKVNINITKNIRCNDYSDEEDRINPCFIALYFGISLCLALCFMESNLSHQSVYDLVALKSYENEIGKCGDIFILYFNSKWKNII